MSQENKTKKQSVAQAIQSGNRTALLGAAFLMATSSIGPGFLNNTVVYTKQFMGALAIVIIISVLLDIAIHQNVWSIICVTGKRTQDAANELKKGLGYVLLLLVLIVSLIANTGNVGGVAMSLQIFGVSNTTIATLLAGAIALIVFLQKDIKAAMDKSTTYLGILMIALCFYLVFKTKPPVTTIPSYFDDYPLNSYMLPIISLVGGSAGAYLSLTGPHRLIDAGITGMENIDVVKKSALTGSIVGATMRALLYLTAFGVLAAGIANYDAASPAASVFQAGAGVVGYYMFAIVLFAAAVTSVIGCSYTGISLLKSVHPIFTNKEKECIIIWIVVSTLFMAFFGRPAALLVISGAFNGLILPFVLTIVLLIGRSKRIMGPDFKNPVYLEIIGWMCVLMTGYTGLKSLPALMQLF